MSINRERPHLVIIPEDEADAGIANGFLLELDQGKNVAVLNEAGGWSNTVDYCCNFEVRRMRAYPDRHVVLLIDFDGKVERLEEVKRRIPMDVAERVFVIGSRTTPEDLKAQLGTTLEGVGGRLAKECRENTMGIWQHHLLAHNADEVTRLYADVRDLLF